MKEAINHIDTIASSKVWLEMDESIIGEGMSMIGKPLQFAMNQLPENAVEQVNNAMVKGFEAIIDGAEWTTNLDEIKEEIANEIADAGTSDSISICAKHASSYSNQTIAAAFAAGFGTGLVGFPGLIADIPILMGLQARVALQIATIYGFDPQDPIERVLLVRLLDLTDRHGEERLTAVNEMLTLTAMTQSDSFVAKINQLSSGLLARGIVPQVARQALKTTINRQVASYVAKQGGRIALATSSLGYMASYGLSLVDGGLFAQAIVELLVINQSNTIGNWLAKQIAPRYAEQLLARKMMSLVPIVGGVFGGSFNAWFTNRNAEAAKEFYRIRFLCENYDAYQALGLQKPNLDVLNSAMKSLKLEDVLESCVES